MAEKQPGRWTQIAATLMHEALKILKEAGYELPGKEVFRRLEERVTLDDWAMQRYEKTGYVRWQSMLSFYTIGLVKAGFLKKKKGVWFLTPEGEEAISKMTPMQLFDHTRRAYAQWRKANPATTTTDKEEEAAVEEAVSEAIPSIDQIEEQALAGIQAAIDSLTPYEFQDLAAALLRGMGYYTPFIAPHGKDGGVDIVAYRDPLGTSSPRIKVQVKHRDAPASVQEVRQLLGLLQKEGDVGIFISSGGFTSDAKFTARSAHVHIELIDSPRFIALWQEFFEKLTDEDKGVLPLRPIYFFSPITS